MKTITSLCVALILTVGLATAVSAQEDMARIEFRLTVLGAPCPNATYWLQGGVPGAAGIFRLEDPDGDGVYTFDWNLPVNWRAEFRFIQGTGTQESPLPPKVLPGEPSMTIKDFGAFPIAGDMVLETSVPGCPATLPDTGERSDLPIAPIAGSILLLAGGIYLRRRVGQRASCCTSYKPYQG